MQTETINKVELNIKLKQLIENIEDIDHNVSLYNIIVDEQLQFAEV